MSNIEIWAGEGQCGRTALGKALEVGRLIKGCCYLMARSRVGAKNGSYIFEGL